MSAKKKATAAPAPSGDVVLVEILHPSVYEAGTVHPKGTRIELDPARAAALGEHVRIVTEN